jgi:F-type H+-transporting ATPase subunit alpha
LLRNIPVAKIKQFEEDFLNHLAIKAPEALAELKKGNLSDSVTAQLEGFAKELEPNYK